MSSSSSKNAPATRTDYKLPSTLTGPPISSVVPPGECQFGEERVSVPLKERYQVSPTTAVLRFGLPAADKPLNLSTCGCVLAHATIDGMDVTRPYTPISTNASVTAGYFDLLVKNYADRGTMSRYLHDAILPGDTTVSFTHIPRNVKIQFPFDGAKSIGMLVGGTGITPMIQALHAILGGKNDDDDDGDKAPSASASSSTKVAMLYGSRTSDDILGKEVLDQWAADYADRFAIVHILSHEPEDTNSDWKGERGMIRKELMEKHLPPPDSQDKIKIFVCGPPPMYDALSGPKKERDKVSGLLGEMGYKPEQVYKF